MIGTTPTLRRSRARSIVHSGLRAALRDARKAGTRVTRLSLAAGFPGLNSIAILLSSPFRGTPTTLERLDRLGELVNYSGPTSRDLTDAEFESWARSIALARTVPVCSAACRCPRCRKGGAR